LRKCPLIASRNFITCDLSCSAAKGKHAPKPNLKNAPPHVQVSGFRRCTNIAKGIIGPRSGCCSASAGALQTRPMDSSSPLKRLARKRLYSSKQLGPSQFQLSERQSGGLLTRPPSDGDGKSTAGIEEARLPAVRRNSPPTRTRALCGAELRPGTGSPEAKSKQECAYPSARSDDAMWGQLVWSLMARENKYCCAWA